MIGELLPATVVAVEAYGHDEPANAWLYPEEEAVMVKAVPKRRREFAVVRGCARRAMEKLGVPPQPVLPGERGAPRWPAGLTGSMTHCDGYSAAALVRTTDLASLGIDAEPDGPLPDGVLTSVALPAELDRVLRLSRDHPGTHWDRLLFSAKESVYKAWFPLTGKWLDFSEADIEFVVGRVGPAGAVGPVGPDSGPGERLSGTFRAELLVPGPSVGGRRLGHFEGRWTARRGLVATAVAVPHG
ncbi:4'-phosphopantetheinyl transferase [Streptomyces sp. NPDC058676]|uniref:4'-phosphopantetheinyl transferase family protein n=1 Tax=unclassified Streptomyces TaxID=2593676 RepID=UPI00365C8B00